MDSLQFCKVLWLVFLFLSLVNCSHVNYVPTYQCETSAGCNFLTGDIWSTLQPPTSADDVYISSGVPITIFVSGSNVSVNSIILAENVNFILLNGSDVSIGNEYDTISLTFYGRNCSVQIFDSTLSVVGVQGRELEIYNGTLTASVGSIALQYVAAEFSDINANFDIFIRELHTNYSIVNGSSVQTEALTAFDTEFETEELQVGNATISNSILLLNQLLFLPIGTVEIIDCETSIETLTISNNSILSFTSSSEISKNVFINTIEYDVSLGNFELHVGDNMNLTLASGPIYTLYLGDQVTINLQGDWVTIYNVQQTPDKFATISTSGFLQFIQDISFYGSINLLENGLFLVNSSVSIKSQDSPAIYGNGTLQVFDDLICHNSTIEVGTVQWSSNYGSITANKLTTPNMEIPRYASGLVNGHVVISSSLVLHGTLSVNGSFSQEAGNQNFTITTTVPATSPYLQINGSANINSPEISATIQGETKEKKWLLVRSTSVPLSLSFSKTYLSQSLTTVRKGGEVFLEIKNEGFWAKNYVYVVVALSIVVAILAGIGIHFYQRRRRRKHYKELNEVLRK